MGTGREQYQRQLEQLRTASVELESSRDDYRVKVDELNSELMELRKKVPTRYTHSVNASCTL